MNPEDEPGRTRPICDGTAARLKELLARVDQAAQSAAARETERQASSQYAARIGRETQTEPQARHQAEVPNEAEIEL
jgi:hypothetical protein